jgi:Spy/CpxP family protein refolding chaperone
MKKSLWSATILTLSFAGMAAFAQQTTPSPTTAQPSPVPTPAAQQPPQTMDQSLAASCPNLTVTQDQKDQLQQLDTSLKATLAKDKIALKAARKAYGAALVDANGSDATIKQKEWAFKREIRKTVNAVLDAADKAAMVFPVEDRAAGVACLDKIRKAAHQQQTAQTGANQCGNNTQTDNDDDTNIMPAY